MRIHRVIARPFRRALVPVLLASASLAAPAAAWEYPLLPHIQGLAFFPEQPSTEYNTFVLLSAVYPNECWEVVDSTQVDSTAVSVTIRRATGCPDTLSTWMRGFHLGFLAAGMHQLTVTCIVLDGEQTAIEEITVPFEVVAGPPPPPPPPPLDTLPILEVYFVSGAEPNHPVTLTLWGFKPFECTIIHNERVVEQRYVEIMMDWQPTCEDTARRWTRSLDLGVFPIGVHELPVNFWVFDGDSLRILTRRIQFEVKDPNEPSPVDSVTVTVHGYSLTPPDPNENSPIRLTVRGSYPPYFCGEILVGRLDPRFELIMRPVRDCTDTTRAWEYTFELGKLPAGEHRLELKTIWRLIGFDALRAWPIAFSVRGTGEPPTPPGPPPDSLQAALSSSKPNPFRDQTTFGVSLADPATAEVSVYDIAGRYVATLHRGMLPRGTTYLTWNGRRRDGSRAAQGIYFYQLVLPDRVARRRVVLLDAP
jgi:hypothetical protein